MNPHAPEAAAQSRAKKKATLYVDLISPYAYFYLKRIDQLHALLNVSVTPVLFGAMLSHWGQLGPAEIESKRRHTYQHCVWLAKRFGLPFQMPARHPFNPLSALRLLVAMGNPPQAIVQASSFVFEQGRDPELDFAGLCDMLGVDDGVSRIQELAVKQALQAQTQEAIDAGVFGVPSLVVDGHCFWGVDTMDWVMDYLQDSQMFERSDMKSIERVAWGVRRKTGEERGLR
ncbi:MAG: 2-hydroxychromene-2-carboxylate isomerase [Betaproteobacteria bacterium]|jgi:2-hydroxychromene-2-carboxylate isomerase|nr:2-hydroxychromene-2-carboxylate isomerase [Pseudomonadota bacterium]NBO04117.1 2-hydroxychromene-2-carboxylate isomerase [Betaproteobacteria bacterium]NBO95084.1 2-hydroxychromene-2-carboxylate isomerase [Betaproteobacteria bacterium]NBP35329.1 2-hydroxychromene-2-carboxylate isomerase [Betaproteobacteria bacterium]NBP37218.1 2-hydroxychromene-2-carboxylate isomerase [Betaproteobacteria bacterium]